MGPCHGDVQLGHKMSESPQIKHPQDPWISIGHWAVHSPTSGLNPWVTNLISVILFSLASLLMERRASFVKLLHVGGTSSSEKTAHISVGNCSPKKQNTHTHTSLQAPRKTRSKSFITLQERPLPNLGVFDPVLPSRGFSKELCN